MDKIFTVSVKSVVEVKASNEDEAKAKLRNIDILTTDQRFNNPTIISVEAKEKERKLLIGSKIKSLDSELMLVSAGQDNKEVYLVTVANCGPKTELGRSYSHRPLPYNKGITLTEIIKHCSSFQITKYKPVIISPIYSDS